MKDRRHLSQHFVAEQVSELVIQPLELVNVSHDHGNAGPVAAGAFDFFYDAQLEKAAVKDSRQAVKVSQLLDPLDVMRVLDGVGTDISHRLERLQFVFAERIALRAVQRKHSERLTKRNQRDAHERAGLLED